MSTEQLTYKPIPVEIETKVFEFAKLNKTFTTKELFEKYPNNPEFVLRYALNNLRINNKIQMYGNKRGSFYSVDFNLEVDSHSNKPSKENDQINLQSIKEKILSQSNKFTSWFKRPDLNLEEPINEILVALKELESEKKLTIRGVARWTEYHFGEVSAEVESVENNNNIYENGLDLKTNIYLFIKKQKVVTIPMLVDEFNLQRYQIIPHIDKLVQEEEIWHEGIKKGSKYIHKDVQSSEVEEILDKLNDERKTDEQIDELSNFLISGEDATCIGIGIGLNGKLEIKMMKNGTIISRNDYESFQDGFKKIREMTTVEE